MEMIISGAIAFAAFVIIGMIISADNKIAGLEPRQWLGIVVVLMLIVGVILNIKDGSQSSTYGPEEYIDMQQVDASMCR